MSESLRVMEGVPAVRKRTSSRLWLSLLLLGALGGILVLLAVLAPSVGASGGCGGG